MHSKPAGLCLVCVHRSQHVTEYGDAEVAQCFADLGLGRDARCRRP